MKLIPISDFGKMTHPVSPPEAGRYPSLSGFAGQGGAGGGSGIKSPCVPILIDFTLSGR
jgi:hypothetical protein